MKYFHNPNCSKSRAGLAFLNDKNVTDIQIISYLEGIDKTDITRVYSTYSGTKSDLIREKEASEAGVVLSEMNTKEAFVDAVLKYPRILERPILLTATQAIIGRPTENFDAVL